MRRGALSAKSVGSRYDMEPAAHHGSSPDSPLEEAGFEPSVPRDTPKFSTPAHVTCLTPCTRKSRREREPILRGCRPPPAEPMVRIPCAPATSRPRTSRAKSNPLSPTEGSNPALSSRESTANPVSGHIVYSLSTWGVPAASSSGTSTKRSASDLHLPKTPWARTKNDRKGAILHIRRSPKYRQVSADPKAGASPLIGCVGW